jgi:hypothetical protein
MTAAAHRLGARDPFGALRDAVLASGVLAATLLVALVAAADRPRVALALVIGLTLLLTGLGASRPMLVLLVVWLVALGFVRRLVSLAAPFDQHDPLLLVGAFGIVLLSIAALPGNGLLHRSPLAMTVLAVQAAIVASAFNPAQGSLLVGLTGLLFMLVPTMGFWIGRGLADDATVERLLRLIALLGILVAVYGLLQTFEGFPSWDATWIRERGYLALNVGDATRPFGSFASSAEYVLFLGVALVACLAFGLRASSSLPLLGGVALLGTAMFLSSTRGAVFTLAGALALMAMARRRVPLPLAPIVAAVAVLAVSPLVERLGPAAIGDGAATDLVRRQVEGLSDPLDPGSSTLVIHLAMIGDGIRSILDNPVGSGAGTVTLAAVKLGGQGGSTEADPSNLAVALGLPGFLAYAALATIAFHRAYRLASERRDALSLAILGLLAVTFFQWFTGGHYAVTFVVWLALGWLDRASRGAQPVAPDAYRRPTPHGPRPPR